MFERLFGLFGGVVVGGWVGVSALFLGLLLFFLGVIMYGVILFKDDKDRHVL